MSAVGYPLFGKNFPIKNQLFCFKAAGIHCELAASIIHPFISLASVLTYFF